MTATVNTAAKFYQQFDDSLASVEDYVPLDCTIFGVDDGGERVSVMVRDPASQAGTPAALWTEHHVVYVASGGTPPVTGFFVAPVGFTFPSDAPPDDGGGS